MDYFNDFIKVIHCDTAKDLLDALAFRGDYLNPSFGQHWLFRGHGLDSWKLLPRALREESIDDINNLIIKKCYKLPKNEDLTDHSQVRAELNLISDFFEISDRAGLTIPNYSHTLQETFRKLRNMVYCKVNFRKEPGRLKAMGKPQFTWPVDELLHILGLAQHHGLPTRLLDWTRSPLFAAYFAAEGFVELRNKHVELRNETDRKSENLLIWGFAKSPLNDMLEKLEKKIKWNSFKILNVPAATNLNLSSQKGAFTVVYQRHFSVSEPIVRKSFEDSLKDELQRKLEIDEIEKEAVEGKTFFIKFTLPHSEASQLLWHLQREGVSRSSLFPGYDGVLREQEMQRYLEEDI